MLNFKLPTVYQAITATLLSLLSITCYAQVTASDTPPVLYQGATLIIGDGTVIENGALLIQGRQILAIGGSEEIVIPAAASIVDLSGKTVIPALIDAHAHLGYEGYQDWGAQNYNNENLIDHLRRYAYYGFGAVFSAGSDAEDLAQEIQQRQSAGTTSIARFLFAAGMAPPGQGPNPQFLGEAIAVADTFGQTVLRGLADPEQARQQVQEVAAKGIPLIKIWVDDRGGSQQKLRPEIYRAVIDEARQLGIKVFVHQQSAVDMVDLVDAGAAGFLHGRLGPDLDSELAAGLAQAGVFLVPNLGLGRLRQERLADDGFLTSTLSPAVAEKLGLDFDRNNTDSRQSGSNAEQDRALQAAFSRLLDAGVDIVLGTDAGAMPNHFFGYAGHRELEIFVELGLSPMQALQAGTSVAARQLGLNDMGSLTAGNAADFVILERNPLTDIRNTRSIVDVVLGGQKLDRDAMLTSWVDP